MARLFFVFFQSMVLRYKFALPASLSILAMFNSCLNSIAPLARMQRLRHRFTLQYILKASAVIQLDGEALQYPI